MSKRVVAGGICAFLTGVFYPLMEHIADIERGYNAIGGEELFLVSGMTVACSIIISGLRKKDRPDDDGEVR